MTMENITIELPWPPSVNHYYFTANVRGRLVRLIGSDGKAYQRAVGEVLDRLGNPRMDGDLRVEELMLHPPNKARRDMDNVLKALWDSLQDRKDKKSGVTIPGLLHDDCQIKEYHCIKWGAVVEGGRVDLKMATIAMALFAENANA